MPSFQDHCEDSLQLFGDRFEVVHMWLDAFAGHPAYGMRHRRLRHHLEGIREVERLYGEKAAMVAKRHIMDDLAQEGWTVNDPFPRDEADYVRIGFF